MKKDAYCRTNAGFSPFIFLLPLIFFFFAYYWVALVKLKGWSLTVKIVFLVVVPMVMVGLWLTVLFPFARALGEIIYLGAVLMPLLSLILFVLFMIFIAVFFDLL